MLDTRPKFSLIEVDIEDVYLAIKKNGYEHIREAWFGDNGDSVGACVLGQGAMNLGVYASGDAPYDPVGYPYNEEGELAFEEDWLSQNTLEVQLNRFEVSPDSRWFISSYKMAGSTIINWNDALECDEDGDLMLDAENYPIYTLKTYEDVTSMAYDVLSPHFGKKVSLLTYDYH